MSTISSEIGQRICSGELLFICSNDVFDVLSSGCPCPAKLTDYLISTGQLVMRQQDVYCHQSYLLAPPPDIPVLPIARIAVMRALLRREFMLG